jgi:uncharacterized NAD(P)/FAD-binding protein YdhS
MNAIAERIVESERREMLNHLVVLGDGHLGRLMRQYQEYSNEASGRAK